MGLACPASRSLPGATSPKLLLSQPAALATLLGLRHLLLGLLAHIQSWTQMSGVTLMRPTQSWHPRQLGCRSRRSLLQAWILGCSTQAPLPLLSTWMSRDGAPLMLLAIPVLQLSLTLKQQPPP